MEFIERERKFLVEEVPEQFGEGDRIEQGYLSVKENSSVRIRKKAGKCTLTVKGRSGLERTEVELELTPEQFEVLWPLTGGARISKKRFLLPFENVVIELDCFEGELAGRKLAEIEFPSKQEAEDFEPPGWLGREVTPDHRYTNACLARDGWPE